MTFRQFVNETSIPKVLFHVFSFSALSGSTFLTILTFSAIGSYGYFFAYEPNPTMLSFEFGLAVYSAFYLGYLGFKFFKPMVKKSALEETAK
jgi:hypothetical protein